MFAFTRGQRSLQRLSLWELKGVGTACLEWLPGVSGCLLRRTQLWVQMTLCYTPCCSFTGNVDVMMSRLFYCCRSPGYFQTLWQTHRLQTDVTSRTKPVKCEVITCVHRYESHQRRVGGKCQIIGRTTEAETVRWEEDARKIAQCEPSLSYLMAMCFLMDCGLRSVFRNVLIVGIRRGRVQHPYFIFLAKSDNFVISLFFLSFFTWRTYLQARPIPSPLYFSFSYNPDI